jgi:hypothetical protein
MLEFFQFFPPRLRSGLAARERVRDQPPTLIPQPSNLKPQRKREGEREGERERDRARGGGGPQRPSLGRGMAWRLENDCATRSYLTERINHMVLESQVPHTIVNFLLTMPHENNKSTIVWGG